MDLKSAEANIRTIATNAGKSSLRYHWTWLAVHPRTITLIALGLIVAAFTTGKGL
ncbi:hypothetical protein HCU64_23835 [Methylobacterium sp. C25]|uniref:hypothetical protein n=1 Tax=Methylobacterium sp. C25 TaxID=2721622 RepID=UPI001F1E4EFF|nr:hypothetical protein [Methylobacterium sp. C25]MCE4226775.1 hypothetical protein [Methylobacterium sp. C25]